MSRPERTADRPWQDLGLVLAANEYAAEVHYEFRKGTTVPYLSHLWAVAALVLEHGGDDQQVAAGLLHDVAEDHGGRHRLDDLRSRFGDDVAGLVEALSDSLVDVTAGEVKPPWSQRKRAYVRHLASADGRAKLICACDKLHNLRSTLDDYRHLGAEAWLRYTVLLPELHLWYYRSLAEVLVPPAVPARLADELSRTVETLADLLRGDADPRYVEVELEDDPGEGHAVVVRVELFTSDGDEVVSALHGQRATPAR